jgi:hypothetical protein
MGEAAFDIGEELRIIEAKMKQLKLDYEQYFIGSRPREPAMLRGEVQKTMIRFANTPIKNTAERFKFNSVNSRFMTFKRQWDDTLRKIEAGTYTRHVFKANLHDRERIDAGQAAESANPSNRTSSAKAGTQPDGDIFASYMKAAKSCGQSVKGLTPEKLQAVIQKQANAIKQKHGVQKVRFRVEVKDGKVKLKATGVK